MAEKSISGSALLRRLWSCVPLGRSLPEDVWLSRHRFLTGLTWFHALVIALVGPLAGYSWEFTFAAGFHEGTVLHTIFEGLIVALFALAGSSGKGSRTFRASAISFGLISSSAILVHLSGGYIELHFHFFVMLVFLALYHDWVPYLVAVTFVAVHHGIVGTLWPEEVFNHPAALAAPWTWAGIHAFFILFQCVGSIITWRFTEKATAQNDLILNSVGESIYGLNRDGRVMFANPVAAETLGLDVQEIVGKPLHELLKHTPANGSHFSAAGHPILAALQDGSSYTEGHELFWRNDGTSFPADFVSASIIERGELTGAVVSLRDVTDRERAAEAVQQSQKKYQDLTNSIDGMVWEADAATFRFAFVSDQAEQILGYPKARWTEERDFWASHIHPEDREWALRFCAKATEEKKPHRFEYRMFAADGRILWFRDIVSVIIENDKPIKLRGIMIDITQRREAEERARRNHERIRALHEISAAASSSLELDVILEALMQKIVALLPYAAVQVWLKSAETGRLERSACLNIDREEWIRRPLKEIPQLVRAAVESRTFVVSKNVQTDPRIWDREFYKKQGIVSYLGVPFIVQDEVLGVLVVLTGEEHEFSSDEIEFQGSLAGQVAMTIHKSQLYEQIKEQADELEKANKEICDFTAMIAHDLRSPLSQVMGVSELMTQSVFGPVTEDQKKWLTKMTETARHLVNLVNDFLDVSKLEAGRVELTTEKINVEKLVDGILENFRFLAAEGKVALRKNISDSIHYLEGDRRRLEQVLGNLLGNAIKFTPPGGNIEVGAADDGDNAKIWVKDTGVGIAHEELGKLFEKYKQTTSGRTSEHKGTGLGLLICKMIVEAHGGRIWAESEESKGTTFTFTIPLNRGS
jgi:PAS domain S-box-containing protein